jgi:hypothetical protein
MSDLGSELDGIIAGKRQAMQTEQIKEHETSSKLESFFLKTAAKTGDTRTCDASLASTEKHARYVVAGRNPSVR